MFFKDRKLKLLESLPEGIQVTHTPKAVRARPNGRSGSLYTWVYQTHISSLDGETQIEEFGAFGWLLGKWRFGTITGKPFTTKNFIEWYSCPNGILVPGRTYTDPNNWSGQDELIQRRTLWYFIGTNSQGNRVKGVSEIVCLAEMADLTGSDLLTEFSSEDGVF